MKLMINVDGGARGNPGPAGIAAVATDDAGEILAERSEAIGEATNNVAEYRAMLLGIELAGELGADEVELIGDSELIVKQVQGKFKVKQEHLRPLRAQVVEALSGLDSWTIRNVPREENERADALVNEALDALGSG
ncbi:MAG: ribonuclease HI family protein [Solirubrobacterales bacterium]|nr:ribonuclease HI family protein [Solirubrobacterales bacterium]